MRPSSGYLQVPGTWQSAKDRSGRSMMARALLALSLLLLLSLALGPQALAAGVGVIQGQIVNGTENGGSVAGIEVNLYGFQGNSSQEPITAIVDASGVFRFDGLETGSDWAYLIQAAYGGVTYSSSTIAFEAGQTETEAMLLVYESTEDDSGISVERAHLLLSFTEAGLKLTEVYVFRNPGDRTYVGKDEVDGRRAVAAIQLPRGARALGFDDGSLGGRFIATKDGFADTEPQWPGQTSVVFSYELDCPSRQCTLVRTMPAPTLNLNVLLPSVGTRLESDRLSFGGEMDAQGQSYLNYTGINLGAGERVSLRLVPMSGAASSSDGSSSQSPLAIAAIVMVAIGGLVALGYPLLRKRAAEAPKRRRSD